MSWIIRDERKTGKYFVCTMRMIRMKVCRFQKGMVLYENRYFGEEQCGY